MNISKIVFNFVFLLMDYFLKDMDLIIGNYLRFEGKKNLSEGLFIVF